MYRTHTEDPWPDVQDAIAGAMGDKPAVCSLNPHCSCIFVFSLIFCVLAFNV